MIDTTKILAAAQIYQKNRKRENWDNQAGEVLNKTVDSQRIFDEMIAAGLKGCYSTGGGFYGIANDKTIFSLYLYGKSIEFHVDLSMEDHIQKLKKRMKDCGIEDFSAASIYDFLNQ